MNRHNFPFLLACTALLAPAMAQAEEAAATDIATKVARAIADYEAVKDDAQKVAQKRRAMLWLGDLEHADVTTYLQRELAAAGNTQFAAVVCEAIGRHVRPQLVDALLDVLQREGVPPMVRNAAGLAAAKSGVRAIGALVELVKPKNEAVKPAVREAALAGLVDGGGEPAHRELLELLGDGVLTARVRLLRRMDNVQHESAVDAARIKLVREGEIELAALAWKQLAIGKHGRAKELAIDVLERIVDDPKAQVAADLIGGIVRVRDNDLYPLLIKLGSQPVEIVRKAVREAAPAVAEDPALVQWLLTKGLDDERAGAREVAKLLLLAAPTEAVRPLVDRLRSDLRAGKKKAFDQAVGLHEILAKDPTWRLDLGSMAAANDVEHRLLGLSLLLEIGADNGVLPAQQSLSHKQWELRSLAFRYLARCRDVTSIPLLIARYGREDGRLAAELDTALFVHTGTRMWKRVDWESWWNKHKTGFALPHPDSVKGGGTTAGGKTVSYHDIPVVSSRIAFVVDHSGSMNAQIGTDKKYTRLDAAKEQLVRVVQALPKDTSLNLIAYDSNIQPLFDDLRKLDDETREKVLKTAQKLALGSGTNIFDALEKALNDPLVDTIYLLTDGQPTEGRLRNPDDIIDEVQRMNRTRQVVVHCIGLGIDSDLLKRLAAVTGGSYKHIR